MQTKISAWLLERAAQGELDGAELAELRSRLAGDGRSLEDALEKLRRSDREILAQLPRDMMGAAIRRRAGTDGPPHFRLRLAFRPLAVAGTLALVILAARGLGDYGLREPASSPGSSEEQTIIKGDESASPRLLLYRQRPHRGAASDPELLADGARGARGDLVQLAYDKAGERLYGVLVSIDGARRVTQHLPDEGAMQAAPLVARREVRMPSAYELDDAPDFERFVLVTASQPFAIKVVLDAASALAHRGAAARTEPLPLGPSFHQISILLNKSGGSP